MVNSNAQEQNPKEDFKKICVNNSSQINSEGKK